MTQYGRIVSNVFFYSIYEHIQGQLSSHISFRRLSVNVSHVIETANPFKPAFMSENMIQFLNGHIIALGQVDYNSRIDIAGARSHNDSRHWSHPHGSVNAPSPFNGAGAGTAA